ncbi:lipid A biosynthesis domain-containing protein [Pseudodesulfovibrio senegalensis]|uniref:Lipid A biosynthesis domain-containing protein n=2 Tax=Pseudodesulfovibrio senegalensis TaxID=1721087 RepID=A0A6N6NBF9_9BACT|nr:lipid A biosynthesis domain-containing protein [Pseudodesulfovibrio senegalensis]KAB1443887.1 lipid A biosynthesis domain-containing protein [Pseudodesulfovibrio senegalensis]
MVLPQFWWLLLIATLGQLAYFVAFFILRWRSKDVQEMPLATQASLWIGGLCGLGYGFMQSDFLFVVGQACVLLIAIRMTRKNGAE